MPEVGTFERVEELAAREVEARLEEVIAPGFRERMDRAFLESLETSESVM